MKKLFLCMVFAVLLGVAFAQKKPLSPSLERNNEIKINIPYILLFSPEITYERIINQRNAVGVAAFLRVTTTFKSDFSYGFTPYYRYYFGVNKASGFFLEGLASVTRYDNISSTNRFYYDSNDSRTFQNSPIDKLFLGLGAALGAKFLTRKGFTGEIYVGGTKSLDYSVVKFFPRAGLILGKRF